MDEQYGVSSRWEGGWDEAGIAAWAGGLRSRLDGPVDLAVAFVSPDLANRAADVLEAIRFSARAPLLVGCSSPGLIAGTTEAEAGQGVALALLRLPGARLKVAPFTRAQVEEAEEAGPGFWRRQLNLQPEDASGGWLAFADPFHFCPESWLRTWQASFPGIPVYGGLAAGFGGEPMAQVYCNGRVITEGGVALAVSGDVALEGCVSHACEPLGEPLAVTAADGHLLKRVGGRTAIEALESELSKLPAEARRRCRGNLFVGLAADEGRDEFRRGDFLVRAIFCADRENGTLAVGAVPRPGQTLQFHARGREVAILDWSEQLASLKQRLNGRRIYAACLCECSGRGEYLFEEPDHDAIEAQRQLGPLPLAGFFGNGEIGPCRAGERSYMHGYTAALAVFAERAPRG
jgi:small ligand-binding sensory domain FIST